MYSEMIRIDMLKNNPKNREKLTKEKILEVLIVFSDCSRNKINFSLTGKRLFFRKLSEKVL